MIHKPLTLDFETTFYNHGNPFDSRNFFVVLGVKYSGEPATCIYFDEPDAVPRLQRLIDGASILIGFNAKFDLHHLRKAGINFEGKPVWDCQVGEFLLENQKNPYPSLNQAAEKYGLGQKMDVIKLEYWDKGINTDEIPRPILTEYLEQDLHLTEQVYLKQREQFQTNQQGKYALFRLQCQDLLVLEEYEANGIKFNTKAARLRAEELSTELEAIHKEMVSLVGNVPFNLNSGDHVSCILYGGTITIDDRIPVGVYKTGKNIGATRYKIIKKNYELPRLCEPLKGTEVKKPEGSQPIWQTNEDVLATIKLTKHSRKLVNLIQSYTKLDKLRGTYLEGIPLLIEKMNWEPNMIHGNLNQCVACTGRLSSTKPNLQNMPPETKVFMESRYP